MDDDFLIHKYKITKCPMIELEPHSSEDCIYLHDDELPRRHPSKYKALLCENVAAGRNCPRGDECEFVHTMVEYRLHPDTLKRTPPCIFGFYCDEDCIFPHRADSEPSIASSSVDSGSSIASSSVESTKSQASESKQLKKPPSLEELLIQSLYTDDKFMSTSYKKTKCSIPRFHDCPLLHEDEKVTQPRLLDISKKSPLCKYGKQCSRRRPCLLPHDACNAADPKSIKNLDHIVPTSQDHLQYLFSHLLTNDHFMMNHYKREKCRCVRYFTHDGTTCPFYIDEEERRRTQSSSILSLCESVLNEEDCFEGDDCPYIHTHIEHRLHSDIFLNTPPCIFGAKCSDFPCFFPHGSSTTL